MNPQMHTDHVDEEDGTINDCIIETYYAPIESLAVADGYLRVFADNGGTNIETRIAFETLTALGWTAPDEGANARAAHAQSLLRKGAG